MHRRVRLEASARLVWPTAPTSTRPRFMDDQSPYPRASTLLVSHSVTDSSRHLVARNRASVATPAQSRSGVLEGAAGSPTCDRYVLQGRCATCSAPSYLMYQCPAIDTLNRSASNPGNAVGSRRYPSSALSPNRVTLANVSSPPPKTRNPTPLSDMGSIG